MVAFFVDISQDDYSS